MKDGWKRVSKSLPCPICQHTDWCLVSTDGNVCICQRVESDRPTRNSGGWIHRLRGEMEVEKRGGGQQWNGQHRQRVKFHAANQQPISEYFAALPTDQDDIQNRMCGYLEGELGLPKEIMKTLDWRWDKAARAVAIPMRDAGGLVTGIRYRALKTGAKWAKRGSKDGLFFDPEFIPYDPEELIVCEGPTDCAAAMAAGFWAVGRSSCGTGRDEIKTLMTSKGVRRITIVADDDKPKPKPGGGTWRPGIDGAQRLADQLGMAYRIVLPPPGFKDLRDWYCAGTLNAESFNNMCRGNDWHGGEKAK